MRRSSAPISDALLLEYALHVLRRRAADLDAESSPVRAQNFSVTSLGNELGVNPNLISVDPNVNGTLVHGNYQEGDISWDPNLTEQKIPNSLYLRAKPAFFQDAPWPATGSDRVGETETIPAEERYLNR